jgi:hypothetical protein
MLEVLVDRLVATRHVSRAVEVLSTDQFGFGIGKACHRKEAFTVLIRYLSWRSHVGLASSLLQAARKEFLGLDNHVHNDVMGGWARFRVLINCRRFGQRCRRMGWFQMRFHIAI